MPVGRPEDPVADSGDESQRDGVSYVGTDDPPHGQVRIKQHQSGHADGTRADRRN
jgi:hypothetical protein